MSITQPNQTQAPSADSNLGGVLGAPAAPAAQQLESNVPYTPEQIIELEQYAIAATRRLKEYDDDKDYKRVKDPKYRDFWNQAVEYYDKGLESQSTPGQSQQIQAAQLDPETREAVTWIREQKTQTERQQREEYDRWLAEQRVVGQRLQQQYGLTPDDLGTIAEVADAENKRTGKRVGLEQAYQRISGFSPWAGSTPPTVGLRGDSSMPGVPGPSMNNDAYKTDFHTALTARLRAGQ